MNKIVRLKGISKIYKNDKKILDKINLELLSGEIVVITGPSGCGKSTLLNIVGLIDTPSFGEYYLDNVNVYNLKEKNISQIRNERIGYIFQAYHLITNLSVLENIFIPLLYKKKQQFNIDFYNKKIEDILKMLEIYDLKNEKVENLSGGEKQRVAIARALITDPTIILADEPTGNLDSVNRDKIIEIFEKIRNDLNKTILIVTHDFKISRSANRWFELIGGKLIEKNIKK